MRAFCVSFDTSTTPDSTSLVLLATELAGVAAMRVTRHARQIERRAGKLR
ncbi:MAG TPA: hypothetical protein VF034_00230 [Gemmatimonadaceae bacterium]|jgi:hypothetical protein